MPSGSLLESVCYCRYSLPGGQVSVEERCSGPFFPSLLSPKGEKTPTLATFSGSAVMKALSAAVPLWEMAQWKRPQARGDIICRGGESGTHESHK